MALLPVLMLGFWALVIVTVAFFVVREVRQKRKPIADFDRHQHEAAGEASMRSQVRGPQSFGGWGGGS